MRIGLAGLGRMGGTTCCRRTLATMVAFDTAKVERALRGPLGDEAAREVTEALAEGLTRTSSRRPTSGWSRSDWGGEVLLLTLASSVIILGAIAIATAMILNELP